MKLYAVMCDAGGAHEAECVYSVWTTRAGAEQEEARLWAANPTGGGCYRGAFYILEIEADHASDEWIG